MRKNLLTISLLVATLSVQAQTVLLHVDDTANMYVSNGTLVYNGGGLQTKGSGKIDLYGNMMVQGNGGSDVLKTITNDPTPVDKLNGGNIVVKLNDPLNPVTSPYGQLYISGFSQSAITGVIDKEYAATKHGAYQQIGIPFMDKSFGSLSLEFGNGTSVFNNTRWGGREVLKWSNQNLRWDGSIIPTAPITSLTQAGIALNISSTNKTTLADRTSYFTMGTSLMDPTLLRTLKGRPFSDGITGASRISLTPPSTAISFGAGGINKNIYQERYNTYIFDAFDTSSPWTSTWGRNTYQFSNPYLTNLDLSLIGFDETTTGATVGDNNALTNIWGIAVDPQNVVYSSGSGTTSSYADFQRVTFDTATGIPQGNYNALIVKPLGTFKIKLRNNTPQLLDFDNLRRFSSTPRANNVSYSVTAAKNGSNGTVKQLGVLALDAAGNQIGETYYVVAPHFTTGNIQNPNIASVQATTNTSAIIQTFEESVNGGIDSNFSSAYRLYINEANETNYLGKRIDLNIFGSNVASLKFQIRDNAELVPNGTHLLSGGKGFYYNVGTSGQPVQINQGDIIPVNGSNFGLYYGTPQTNGSLNTQDNNTKSRTLVTYNPAIEHYIVRFDPAWKSASVEVFDASGKLVISQKSIKTDSDFVIKLDSTIKANYIVKVVGNDSTVVTAKILIK
ncbi:T9SS type A sorting domain-containing protein [Chryseobacterium echinoideorum]|uniref:T9SS type A sorting domain-containing protein n=1 Tax=Chryseobacterium echinoideorum TaxID=1549648 RepID=UPI0016293099|nr:T9SS type A sorting domain-containing protein [Chryseobacterium echinoideorum]